MIHTFIFSECLCSPSGSEDGHCDSTGQCTCKVGFTGTNCRGCAIGFTGTGCDRCLPGYTGYPNCANKEGKSFSNHLKILFDITGC